MMDSSCIITEFQGDFRFLSNFWPCKVMDDDCIIYPSVEHYYVAQKTDDLEMRRYIRDMETAGEAKRFGRKIIMTVQWTNITRLCVMERGLRQKFSPTQNKELADLLDATGNAIIQEGNNWGDEFWGINLKTGKGRNNLGNLLMDIRHSNRIGIFYGL